MRATSQSRHGLQDQGRIRSKRGQGANGVDHASLLASRPRPLTRRPPQKARRQRAPRSSSSVGGRGEERAFPQVVVVEVAGVAAGAAQRILRAPPQRGVRGCPCPAPRRQRPLLMLLQLLSRRETRKNQHRVENSPRPNHQSLQRLQGGGAS